MHNTGSIHCRMQVAVSSNDLHCNVYNAELVSTSRTSVSRVEIDRECMVRDKRESFFEKTPVISHITQHETVIIGASSLMSITLYCDRMPTIARTVWRASRCPSLEQGTGLRFTMSWRRMAMATAGPLCLSHRQCVNVLRSIRSVLCRGAARAFRALDSRDGCRVDTRVGADGIPPGVKLHPIAGLAPACWFPRSARARRHGLPNAETRRTR